MADQTPEESHANAVAAFNDAAFVLIPLAAAGSRDAQAKMTEAAIDLALVTDNPDILAGARWFARLAAAHHGRNDIMRLAAVLTLSATIATLAGDHRTASGYRMEATGALAGLITVGDPDALRVAAEIQAAENGTVQVMIPDRPEEAEYLLAAAVEGVA